MSFGATETGFIKKTEQDIIDEMRVDAKDPTLFGPDVDISPYSPVGKEILLSSRELARAWDALEQQHDMSFIESCEGVELDRVAAYRGTYRKLSQSDTVDVTFTGTDTTAIPVDFEVSTAQAVAYKTTEAGVISGGSIVLETIAVIPGLPQRVAADQLTQIVAPLAGLDSVTNALASDGGRDRETDPELRTRVIEAAKDQATRTGAFPELINRLENEAFIVSAFIKENNQNTSVGNMPPHSLWFVIEGGTDAEVAQVIYEVAPPVRLVGAETDTITDPFLNDHVIYWDRPTSKDIYVKFQLSVTSEYSLGNEDIITNSAIEIIGGTNTTTAEVFAGLGIGQDVSALKLFPALADINGITDASILLGFSAPPTLGFLDIDANENPYTENVFITFEYI